MDGSGQSHYDILDTWTGERRCCWRQPDGRGIRQILIHRQTGRDELDVFCAGPRPRCCSSSGWALAHRPMRPYYHSNPSAQTAGRVLLDIGDCAVTVQAVGCQPTDLCGSILTLTRRCRPMKVCDVISQTALLYFEWVNALRQTGVAVFLQLFTWADRGRYVMMCSRTVWSRIKYPADHTELSMSWDDQDVVNTRTCECIQATGGLSEMRRTANPIPWVGGRSVFLLETLCGLEKQRKDVIPPYNSRNKFFTVHAEYLFRKYSWKYMGDMVLMGAFYDEAPSGLISIDGNNQRVCRQMRAGGWQKK